MISTVLLWVIVLLNLLLTFGLMRRTNAHASMPKMETLKVGQPAPDFTAQTLDGETVTLAQYAGRQLVMIFLSSTCAPCVEKLPELQAIAADGKHKNTTFVLVFKQSADEVSAFANQHLLTMPIWTAQPPNPLWQDYKVPGTPFYCAIDSRQKVALTDLLGADWKVTIQQWLN